MSDSYEQPECWARSNYLVNGTFYIPDVYVDAYDIPSYTYSGINSYVQQRKGITREGTIDITWDYDGSTDNLEVTAEVTLDDDLPSPDGSYRLYIYIIEMDVNGYDFVFRDSEYYSLNITGNGEQQSETANFDVGNFDVNQICLGAFFEDHLSNSEGGQHFSMNQGAMVEYPIDTSIQPTSLGHIKALFE